MILLKKIFISLAFVSLLSMPFTIFAADPPKTVSPDTPTPTPATTPPATTQTTAPATTPTTQTTATTPSATQTTAPAAASGQPTFVPLTSIPGIADAGTAPDLSSFLNNLYKICIGVAGVLAVLKIVQGGITYMLGDSVTEKREAKHHIALAIFGLVLVLAPALVFGIIDPRILSLQINTSTLTPGTPTAPTGPTDHGVATCNINGQVFPPIANGQGVSSEAQKNCCTNQGFHLVAVPNVPGSFTCYEHEPAADPTRTPGASGQTQISGQTYYFHNFPANLHDYAAMLGKSETVSGTACLHLAFGAFSTREACTTALTATQQSHSGWSTLSSCTQATTNYVSIQTSESPICEEFDTIQ